MSETNLREIKTQLADQTARHGAAVFLILLALVGLDTMSIEDPQERQKVTAAWVGWGVIFILLGFFIITPEQNAIAIRRASQQ